MLTDAFKKLLDQYPQAAIDLPSLKKASKLPVVLNLKELRILFCAPTLLKHRILLMLAYSGGLRAQEVCNLKIGDIDFERMSIHIRQGKGSARWI